LFSNSHLSVFGHRATCPASCLNIPQDPSDLSGLEPDSPPGFSLRK
jgi:hypothetical protein